MKLELRRLDPIADLALYETAYRWLMDSPSWRRQTEAIFGTLDHDEYMTATHSEGRCDVGIFRDGELTAIVILTITAKHTYEVHFESEGNVDPELIIAAGHMIRSQLFGEYGAQLAYTWTPSWNRTVLAIDKAIGFVDDGVRMLHGTCRGRLVEWIRLSLRG
jgi:hypothetical protein